MSYYLYSNKDHKFESFLRLMFIFIIIANFLVLTANIVNKTEPDVLTSCQSPLQGSICHIIGLSSN